FMDRKEFLSKLGLGAAFVLTASCLGSCTKETTPEPLDENGFTIDLNSEEAAPLMERGGYIIKNDVVIGRSNDDEYLAATVVCSHAGQKQVSFRANNGEWLCNAHGARFAFDGTGLNRKGEKGLTIYRTELTGSELRILN
ncbi:MAG: Rieske 2Fe-2S domain-containing protein, partial [Bacteroidota bacterium]